MDQVGKMVAHQFRPAEPHQLFPSEEIPVVRSGSLSLYSAVGGPIGRSFEGTLAASTAEPCFRRCTSQLFTLVQRACVNFNQVRCVRGTDGWNRRWLALCCCIPRPVSRSNPTSQVVSPNLCSLSRRPEPQSSLERPTQRKTRRPTAALTSLGVA